MKNLQLHNPGRKFWLIIGSVILAVALVAGGAFWVLRSVESSTEANISKSKLDVGGSLRMLNSRLVNKEITPKERLNAFTDFNRSLTKLNGDMCREDSKNIVFTISKANERCDTAHEKLLAIKAIAEKLEQSIKDDQSLNKAITLLASVDATNTAKQLEAWKTTETTLQGTDVSSDGLPVKVLLVSSAQVHQTILQEIINSDKAQNKASYTAASAKLSTAHTDLKKITELQTATFKNLTLQLRDSAKAFKDIR